MSCFPHLARALASDILLQIADPMVAHAIASSTLLQPYLRGQLGPQTFLVHHETASELQRQLLELGLQVGGDLLLGEKENSETSKRAAPGAGRRDV